MTIDLVTRRLRLRPPCSSDAEAIARHLNNFAVAGNLAQVPYPYARCDAEAWLCRQRPDPEPGQQGFAIELTGAGHVGQIGFHLEDGRPTLGYWLGQPFWHRGLMTEAAAAAIGWFFTAADAPAVYSGVFAFNKASLAVQKKLGFTETGIGTRHCLARGEELRHIDTRLSRGRWEGIQP